MSLCFKQTIFTSLSLSVSVCLSVCLSLCAVSLSVCLSVSVSLSVSVCLCLFLSLSLSVSVSLSVFFFFSETLLWICPKRIKIACVLKVDSFLFPLSPHVLHTESSWLLLFVLFACLGGVSPCFLLHLTVVCEVV